MIYGFIAVAAVVILLWIRETKKAAQDPDIKEASELGIVIYRYRKYKEAWDKIQSIYRTYGIDNPVSNKMVNEIIEKLPNMNEWRRFGEKQRQKQTQRMYDMINGLKNGN